MLLTYSFINIFLSETQSEPISIMPVDLSTWGKVPGVWCQTCQVKAAPNTLPMLIDADNLSFKCLNRWSMQGQHSDFQLQSEEVIYDQCAWRWRRVPRTSNWHISTFINEAIGDIYDASVYMALFCFLHSCWMNFSCFFFLETFRFCK